MKILIMSSGGVGDALMTTPMYREIKKKYPTACLSVGVDQKINIDLLSSNPNIDSIFDISDYKGIIGILRLVRRLRKQNFNYCFHNHSCHRRKYTLIPYLAGIKHRIGFNRKYISSKKGYHFLSMLFTKSFNYFPGKMRRTETNLLSLREIGIYSNNTNYDLPVKPLQSKKKYLGIHPGSNISGKHKRWSAIKYNKLSLKIINQTGIDVKIYIGPYEKELIDFFDISNKLQTVQTKSINELIYDISSCSYFLSNDSGLAHISAAIKIPTIVIYGSTTKEEYILPTKYLAIENPNAKPNDWYLKRNAEEGIRFLKNLSVQTIYDKVINFINEIECQDQ